MGWERFREITCIGKVKGKCTTDHISPAGMWLMYRGHLDKISDNLLLGAVNAYHDGKLEQARIFLMVIMNRFHILLEITKSRGLKWIIIGDRNYGEGSSREHAAMTPRYLGCAAVIARSFARIHETNLKKQGILALTFIDPLDYEKILEYDRLSISGLEGLKPKQPVRCTLHHRQRSR